MRIISGKYRGFQIRAPKNIPARPTTDRSKESLFNILQHKIELEGIRVLDLCAGTGNMGYEFASRGAASVTSVDQSHHAIRFIQATFKQLGFEHYQTQRAEALQFVKRTEQQFDLIFADPPYAWNGFQNLVDAVLEGEILRPEGLFIIEHQARQKFEHPMRVDFREYGQSAFSIFQKKT